MGFDESLKSSNPLGFCPNCRKPLLTINGVKSCPACASRSEKTHSEIRNTTADPGHDAMKKITKDLDKNTKLINTEGDNKAKRKPGRPRKAAQELAQKSKPTVVAQVRTADLQGEIQFDGLSSRLIAYLDDFPIINVAEAKEVMKIQELIKGGK